MNFQATPSLPPLRVIVVNPLTSTAQLIIVRILSGDVFGPNQLIDMIILVFCNETLSAESFAIQLMDCAFPCYNSIQISTDLPKISDADVFCFVSKFSNPNRINIQRANNQELFDCLYLIIKVASNLIGPIPAESPDVKVVSIKKKKETKKKPMKPLIITDGLATLDILMSISKDLPSDIFFCPTYITDASKSILGEYLKVDCDVINDVYVWAADDTVLHIEVDRPLKVYDTVDYQDHCDVEVMTKEELESHQFDHTQLSASWLKKEFKEKVAEFSSKNPYGSICRATGIVKTLQILWKSRTSEDGQHIYGNIGVIGDGSNGTTKGHPYVLPLILSGNTWSVNRKFEQESFLKKEMKRINAVVKKHHIQLIGYCKKFKEQQNLVEPGLVEEEDFKEGSYTTCASSRPTVVYENN